MTGGRAPVSRMLRFGHCCAKDLRWWSSGNSGKDAPECELVEGKNRGGLTQPADVTKSNYDVHSPAWGPGFQKLARAAGVICYVKHREQPTPEYKDTWNFLVKRQNGSL